jgi:hypothetical protein
MAPAAPQHDHGVETGEFRFQPAVEQRRLAERRTARQGIDEIAQTQEALELKPGYAGESPHLGSAVLHNADPRVTLEHYNRATSLSAAESFRQIVRQYEKT